MQMSIKRGLGLKGKKTHFGLHELMGDMMPEPVAISEPVSAKNVEALISDHTPLSMPSGERIAYLPIHECMPGRFQPRRHMDENALNELVQSIQNQGVISPIVVRQMGEKQYEIIAGERRFQAAKKAGLKTIPAVVRALSDQAAMVIGLIENIQREQLSALEEAQAFSRLLLEFKMTHEDVASAVGKSRTAVTNTMRLLQLTTGAKTFLEEGKIQAGHARALLSLPKELQSGFAKKIASDQLSVRQTEQMVQKYLSPKEDKLTKEKVIDPDVQALEQRLCDRLATKVSIKYDQKGTGMLQVHFNSLAQLDDILAMIE
jgi:ParB family chromosome partitioning protein